MEDEPQPPENKLKLGQRSFEKVNQPSAEPDPNAIHQILNENRGLDPSFELHGIDEEIARLWRKRRQRDLKVFAFIGIVDALCLAIAAHAQWNAYVTVPLISMGAMVTAATLWIVYVVMP